VENLKARISEAVLGLNAGQGEWFRAMGREQSDRRQEDAITAYLDYTLDHNKFKMNLDDMVATMLIYSFLPLKTRWDRQYDFRVKRDRKREVTDKGVRWKTTRKEEEVCVYDGPAFDMVDPAMFICDTYETDPQKMMYVGDRRRMTFEEIAELGERGVYENWRELETQEPMGWASDHAEWLTKNRSQLNNYDDEYQMHRPNGGPKVFQVVELWCKFDLYGTGRARECVITVANNQTVLRVQENPYDDKHRPYAVARACKYPFDFHSVGPLDHCIPLSIEIDTHRTLALEGTKHAMCPITFVDEDSDIADTLWGIEPGKILQVPGGGGAVQFAKTQSPLGDLREVELHLSEDIQKTSGAIGEYMASSSGSMSATEYQGRINEGSKRIRSYIRSFTGCMDELLTQFHSLSAQYMTSNTKFRVLGADGAAMKYSEVWPQMFDTAVDFEFAAIANLHVVGQEATSLKQFMDTAIVLADKMPQGMVNWEELVWRFWQMSGGSSMGQEIVKRPASYQTSVPQAEEFAILLAGQEAPVSPLDDHMEHLELIEAVVKDPKFQEYPQVIQENVVNHMMDHLDALEKQEAEEKRQAEQQQMLEAAPYPGAGGPNMTNMQRAVSAQTEGGGGPSGTPRGETPGPGRPEQVSSPGRMSGFTQQQNDATAGGY
jgi:hypothetical protein